MTIAQKWEIHPEHGWLHGARPEDPVVQDPDSGIWNVYGYREAVAVLGDPATYSSRTAQLFAEDGGEVIADGDLLQTDPPDHRRQRDLVRYAFTPRLLAGVEPRITELVDELLRAIADPGDFDLVDALCSPLPILVVGEMIGLPRSDVPKLERWMREMAASFGDLSPAADQAEQERVFAVTAGLMEQVVEYLREHVRTRTGAPGEGLLGRLVTAEIDGERLSEDYVVAFVKSMIVAGHSTTSMMLANTVLCLDGDPELDRRVRADRSLIAGLVEESMRFLSPIAATYRVTTRATTLGGRELGAGSIVMVWMAAANRDPRQFSDPDVFDLSRSPNSQLGFGHGIHFCLGAPLARMEARIALNALFDRFPSLRVREGATPKAHPAFDTTGLATLPVMAQ
jgi:cytochrome P450